MSTDEEQHRRLDGLEVWIRDLEEAIAGLVVDIDERETYARAIEELPEPTKTIVVRVLTDPTDPEALAALHAEHERTVG